MAELLLHIGDSPTSSWHDGDIMQAVRNYDALRVHAELMVRGRGAYPGEKNNPSLTVTAVDGATIEGNLVSRSAGAGIKVSSSSTYVRIVRNLVRDAGQWGVGTWDRSAIDANSTGADIEDVRIADNTLTDTQTTKTMDYAISTRDKIAAKALTIERNDARGVKTQPWFFEAGADWLVRENLVDTPIQTITGTQPSVAVWPAGQGGLFVVDNSGATTMTKLVDGWGEGQLVELHFANNNTKVRDGVFTDEISLRGVGPGTELQFETGDVLTLRRRGNVWLEVSRSRGLG